MSNVAASGCGFMLKPGITQDYLDRIMPVYVGVFVLRGRGAFIDWRGQRHALEAGCFVQMPPNRPHSMLLDPDSDWAEFYFTVVANLYEALAALGSVDPQRAVLRPGLAPALIERFERHLRDVREGGDADAALALVRVHELLVDLHRLDGHQRKPSPHADLIEEARRVLGEQLHKSLNLPALASRLGLSYERFRKLFREHVGMPPHTYRLHRRIDQARVLIAQERLSNQQVAAKLGYPDPFTFSKQFRRITGLSPQAFRKLI